VSASAQASPAAGPGVKPISRAEALDLIALPPSDLPALLDRAEAVRRASFGDAVRLCTISNAKSGRCAERCDFCAQSSAFRTGAPVYPMKSPAAILDEARCAASAGARRFSIVTSGRTVKSRKDVAAVFEAIRLIRSETDLEACASLGDVPRDLLARLRDAGLSRYHHNVETAPSFHASIVHTHSWDDEVRVVRAAADLGLDTCCGGILGMGETPAQRVELAFALSDIAPGAVPLNFLDPRPGTPLASLPGMTAEECLAAIAVFRLVLPSTHVLVCGGRERNLGGRQRDAFRAGATGLMIGDYLTTMGQDACADVAMIHEAGFSAESPARRKDP